MTVWPPERSCDSAARAQRYPPAWTGHVLLIDGNLVSVALDDGRIRWFFAEEVVDV